MTKSELEITKATVTATTAILKATVTATITTVLRVIEAEPELPNAIPEKMYQNLKKAFETDDKDLIEEFCRTIVRTTKTNIINRILK